MNAGLITGAAVSSACPPPSLVEMAIEDTRMLCQRLDVLFPS
jgi:hypothetical protein